MQPVDPTSADQLLRAYLRAVWGDPAQPPTYPVRVHAHDSAGRHLDVTVTRHEMQAQTSAPAGDALDLRPVHRKILDHATATPKTAKTLIREAGYTFGSRARSAITELVRAGLLRRVRGGGYVRA